VPSVAIGSAEQAAHALRFSLGSELRPAGVGAEFVGVESQLLRDGVEARPLASGELKGVDLVHDRICAGSSSDPVSLEEEGAG
jgi:hypothetical protein